ncbi:histidine phosphatase family protein [Alkalihalobacillus sp. AL-G]|uniref:histidine phosphatase family protein n=1 Tax=Alkalihalobacillus sp. AL-G TaxID=2926399 RepID=UPI00272C3467|nr:histidine phosphatase family protein [Alkalihalobacillus sp. AL-G]WLD91665.1 histidine phosphatase family protein [Alkalihalobacillus sp. AL-G]
MDDIVVIALFRHGVTKDNEQKAYCGWTDTPLSQAGRHRIQSMQQNYHLYFSSDLTRCTQTSNLLFPERTPIPLTELREMHFGQWEGKTFSELKNVPAYQDWISNPSGCSPPEGERFDQFTDRLHIGWSKIIGQLLHDQVRCAAVVTHGGVIRYLLSQFAPVQKAFWEWYVPHDKAYEFIFDKDALRRGERCTLLQEVPLTVNVNG